MPKFIDLTGHTYNHWTVLRHVPTDSLVTFYLCRCVCGVKRKVRAVHLRSGASKCCGCIRQPTKHGHARKGSLLPEYKVWRAMRARVGNPNAKDYKYYGGKGIKICARWQIFTNFYIDMGKRPDGMSIDRIDSNKDYEPTNCRWATQAQQVKDLPQNQKGYKKKTRNGKRIKA